MLALAASGCGGGSAAAVDLWLGTDAVVARSVTTAPSQPPAESATNATGTERSVQSQTYTVQRNDSISGIARKCGVSMEALVGINEWSDANVQINPDQVIQVPPNGYVGCSGGAAASTTSTASTSSGASSSTSGGSSSSESGAGAASSEPGKCADGSDAKTHTIAAGDNPTKVANANDVTVAELQAANEDNGRVWNSFPIGSKLYLPC